MDLESEKIIGDQVAKLPQEVRDALASPDLTEKIQKIGIKHHLHIDQIGILEDEVTLAMMGMADPNELADTMVTHLSIPKQDAESILDDVSEEIFMPIREAMKKFTEESNSVVMPSAAATPPSPIAAVATTPAPVLPKLATPPTPMPPAKPTELHAADLMLSEPTVSMAPKPAAPAVPPAPVVSTPAPTPAAVKVEPPKPAPYKADPYREPPE